MEQPVLTFWAVPSHMRQAVRRSIHDDVAAQAVRWFADVVDVSEVGRGLPHDVTWYWDGQTMAAKPSR
jgi:hypothetical protein